MAEPTSGGTPGGPGQPKKELSMELRLLIAFILMGVVLFLTPYFYKNVAPPVRKSAPIAVKSEPGAPAASVAPPPVETPRSKAAHETQEDAATTVLGLASGAREADAWRLLIQA